MVLRRWLIVLCMLMPVVAAGQVEDAIEQWLEDGVTEEQVGAAVDRIYELMDNPLNINDTAAVRDMPFMTPFCHRALCNYIVLHGQLLSLKELAFVPGFDSVTRSMMMPMLKVEPYSDEGRMRWWEGRHRVVSNVGGVLERAAGYDDGRYEGDRMQARFCYSYNYRNHVSVRLVADKDPTEVWGRGNYYGYHVMLSDIGRLEKLIVGRYNLQFGQGLTLWTGMQPFNLTGRTAERYGNGVRQASAFYEEGYQEGVAGTLRVGRDVHLSAFGSRTGGEWLAGGRAEWRHGTLQVGATGVYTMLDDSLATRDYVYNQLRPRGSRFVNGGVDVMWQWQRLLLFGEMSVDGDGHTAAIAGVSVLATADNRFGVSWRRYDPRYHNLHAQGYGVGNMQGEQGVSIDAQVHLPLGLTALASVDVHSFNVLRYGAYSPSEGGWLRVQVDRRFGQLVRASMRYAERQKWRNVPNIDSSVYLGEQTVRRQVQGEVAATLGEWTLTTRGVYALFDSESGGREPGWAAMISARYGHGRLQITAAGTWFDARDYYARIYMSESNLQYAWSMPALYGRGLRTYVVARYNLSASVRLAAKYTLTYYVDRETVGSGAAQTEGPIHQSLMLQLRLML